MLFLSIISRFTGSYNTALENKIDRLIALVRNQVYLVRVMHLLEVLRIVY